MCLHMLSSLLVGFEVMHSHISCPAYLHQFYLMALTECFCVGDPLCFYKRFSSSLLTLFVYTSHITASLNTECLNIGLYVHFVFILLEAGVLNEKPPAGFWPKRPPPKPRAGVVLVVEAGVAAAAAAAAAVPRALPKLKPPVLAAGALEEKADKSVTTQFYQTYLSKGWTEQKRKSNCHRRTNGYTKHIPTQPEIKP